MDRSEKLIATVVLAFIIIFLIYFGSIVGVLDFLRCENGKLYKLNAYNNTAIVKIDNFTFKTYSCIRVTKVK